MTDAFVQWFRNASPYIHAHRGQVLVVQFAGEVVESEYFAHLVRDFALLDSLGIRLVLVHGIRSRIDARLRVLGHTPRYNNGLRITDDVSLAVAREAAGAVRVEIESLLSMGVANSPLRGAGLRVVSGNFITARPLGIRGGVDYQHTGEVRGIDHQAILSQLEHRSLVLVSPIGYSPTGESFNMNAEQVATRLAVELKAAKLLLIGDQPELSTASGLPRQLSLNKAEDRLAELRNAAGTETDTTRHLASAIHACSHGVTRAHLLDQAVDGALLLELFTRDGVGVMVNADRYEHIRAAVIDDIGGILELIEPLEQDGILVRRPREKLEQEIGYFTVVERDGTVIACAGLYPFPDSASVELSCLAVHQDYRRSGIGETLLNHLVEKAARGNAAQLIVLTTHAVQWFKERGFQIAAIDELPIDRRTSYNYQRNSRVLVRRIHTN